MINTIHNKNEILEKLIKNQRLLVDNKNKLSLLDLNRISNNLPISIFENNCCIFEGPIINSNNKNYISFFINGKKTSLHRILFNNYVDDLLNSEYLKYSCSNKGKCCTLNHFYKVKKKIINISTDKPDDKIILKIEKKSNMVSF